MIKKNPTHSVLPHEKTCMPEEGLHLLSVVQ